MLQKNLLSIKVFCLIIFLLLLSCDKNKSIVKSDVHPLIGSWYCIELDGFQIGGEGQYQITMILKENKTCTLSAVEETGESKDQEDGTFSYDTQWITLIVSSDTMTFQYAVSDSLLTFTEEGYRDFYLEFIRM